MKTIQSVYGRKLTCENEKGNLEERAGECNRLKCLHKGFEGMVSEEK